jgi:hypothetical protein
MYPQPLVVCGLASCTRKHAVEYDRFCVSTSVQVLVR